MRVVFDLDGTLADTRMLVRRSYELVGIHMPDDVWGRPAFEWLPAIAGAEWHVVHRQKNVAMRTIMARDGVTSLPCARIARQCVKASQYRAMILTGASEVAARGTRHALGLNDMPFLLVSASLEDKIAVLDHYPPGVYFDDNHSVCLSVAELTNWQVVYVSENSRLEDLREAFDEAEVLCRVSSSRVG